MSFEKRSLINNMTATKKAIIASSPASPSVGNKVASKGSVSFSKGSASLSKEVGDQLLQVQTHVLDLRGG